MQAEDAERIRRFLDGDRETLEEIDGWIRSAAWSFRQRLGGEWDDVLQDVRLEAVRLLRSDAFRGDSSLKTYLWYVVNHACLDRLRARSRWAWTDFEAVAEQLERDGIRIPAGAGRHADRDLMWRVLQRTSVECRLLWRQIFAGFSYAEMSAALGIAAGTLRVRVLRCRKKALAIRDQLLAAEDGESAGE